jgi:site-specific recombinase XerD
VALAVGIRQSEAIGLRWQYVDLEAGTIEVGWQLKRARHTAATLLLEQGTGIRVVQHILGHSQLSQTERYTHVTAALSQDAADRMSHALWG